MGRASLYCDPLFPFSLPSLSPCLSPPQRANDTRSRKLLTHSAKRHETHKKAQNAHDTKHKRAHANAQTQSHEHNTPTRTCQHGLTELGTLAQTRQTKSAHGTARRTRRQRVGREEEGGKEGNAPSLAVRLFLSLSLSRPLSSLPSLPRSVLRISVLRISVIRASRRNRFGTARRLERAVLMRSGASTLLAKLTWLVLG